jgi:hypothetical protein
MKLRAHKEPSKIFEGINRLYALYVNKYFVTNKAKKRQR